MSRRKTNNDVDLFLETIKIRYGMEDADIRSLIDNAKWLTAYRKRVEHITTAIGVGVGVAIALALLYALWEGFKHYLFLGKP